MALSRARSLEGLSVELGEGGNDEEDEEGGGGGRGGRRRAAAVVRADPLVAKFDAAVAAAAARNNSNIGGSRKNKNNNSNSSKFRESIAALASFNCRVFGARASLEVDAVEVGGGGSGGSGNGNGAKKKKKQKEKNKAAARNAPPSLPLSAAEILSGIQCYSCRGWGHVVAACPLLARPSGKKKGKHEKKKSGKSNGGRGQRENVSSSLRRQQC